MPISEGFFRSALVAGTLLVLVTAGPSGPARALDGSDYPSDPKATLPVFKNPQQALRMGVAGYRSGDLKSSVEAFKYAAAGGNPLARWKLGKMYADGDGVTRDDAKRGGARMLGAGPLLTPVVGRPEGF